LQPVVRAVLRDEGRRVPYVASLGKTPRSVHQLWQEYQFGIGGRKPARTFSAVERGRVKVKYCRRNIIWKAIDRMVRSGSTAQVAIDRIYASYGELTVTQMMNAMGADEKNGGRPGLQ